MSAYRDALFENTFGPHVRRTAELIKACRAMQASVVRLQALLARMSKEDLDKLAATIRRQDARRARKQVK